MEFFIYQRDHVSRHKLLHPSIFEKYSLYWLYLPSAHNTFLENEKVFPKYFHEIKRQYS